MLAKLAAEEEPDMREEATREQIPDISWAEETTAARRGATVGLNAATWPVETRAMAAERITLLSITDQDWGLETLVRNLNRLGPSGRRFLAYIYI